MRKFVALLFGIFIVACSRGLFWSEPRLALNGQLTTTATVCLYLPEKQINEAIKAVEDWDHSLRGWKHLVAVNAFGSDIFCGYTIREMNPPENDSVVLAEASMIGGHEIRLYRGRYEMDTKGIVMHELGHCLGAQHVSGTLMNPHWYKNAFRCPDQVTVAQVAAFNQVNLGRLAWCWGASEYDGEANRPVD